MKIIYQKIQDLNIKWRMLAKCNYDCSYCVQRNTVGKRLLPWDKDFTTLEARQKQLEEAAPKINSLIENSKFNSAAIALIGGECSLLELKPILSLFTTNKLKRITLTTNLSRGSDYYNELPVDIVASFHHEYNTIDSFIEKCKKITRPLIVQGTDTDETKDIIDELVVKLQDNNIEYKIDSAMRKGKSGRNFRNKKAVCYVADGKEYSGRLSMLRQLEEEEGYDFNDYHAIKVKGLYCSECYDFIDIDVDKIRIRDEHGCKNAACAIQDFSFKEAEPCEADYCKLCGKMSVSNDKNDIYFAE